MTIMFFTLIMGINITITAKFIRYFSITQIQSFSVEGILSLW